MTELLFDRDPVTKTVQTFHYDEATDQFTIADATDVEPILEANKTLLNEDRGKGKDLHRVASIPMVIWDQLQREWRAKGLSWEERQAAMKKWLNDPDNRLFRTTTQRV
jgi:hypothetical protein